MDNISTVMQHVLALFRDGPWKQLVIFPDFRDYLERAVQMLGLQTICMNLPLLEAYLKGLIEPRNVATGGLHSLPPHLTHINFTNRCEEREMSFGDVLDSDTDCHFTKGKPRKNLHGLALETLTKELLKTDGECILENMERSLPSSWFTSALALIQEIQKIGGIQDICGLERYNDRKVLSLIIVAWDELLEIYKTSAKKTKGKTVKKCDIKKLASVLENADLLKAPNTLLWIYADTWLTRGYCATEHDL